MNKLNQILKLQNIIALEELKMNYNKSENDRVLGDLVYEPTETYLTLKNILDELFKETEYEVELSSLGTITIKKLLGETFGISRTYQIVETLYPTVKLPYAYVMGQKIGKKVARAYLEKYGMTL